MSETCRCNVQRYIIVYTTTFSIDHRKKNPSDVTMNQAYNLTFIAPSSTIMRLQCDSKDIKQIPHAQAPVGRSMVLGCGLRWSRFFHLVTNHSNHISCHLQAAHESLICQNLKVCFGCQFLTLLLMHAAHEVPQYVSVITCL